MTGDSQDYDAALAATREALTLPVTGGGHRQAWLWSNVGAAFDARFRHSGHADDIDAAVEAHRAAVAAAVDDPGHALSNLGAVLRARSEYLGNIKDLEDAVTAHSRAVDATASGHPERARRLSRYGVAQYALARWTDDPERLRAAIDIQRDALASAPTNSADRVQCLISLASTVRALGDAMGESSHTDEAADLLRLAAASPGLGSHRLAVIRLNLGAALTDRFTKLHRPDDLDEACGELDRGAREAPVGTAIRAALAAAAGKALSSRYELTASTADRDAAVAYLWEAIDSVHADRNRRIDAARALSRLAMAEGRPEDALRALRTAIDLLLAMTWQMADRRSGQHQLQQAWGLAADAAACALACKDVRAAVELSEAGRSVLWAQTLHLRMDMAPVAERDPQLARRLVEVANALRVPPDETADELAVDRRTALAREWDKLVAQARQQPGLERFLLPPSFAALAAEVPGPTVLINVSRWRSDAIIIAARNARVVRLPQTSWADINTWSLRYLSALTGIDEPLRQYRLAAQQIADGDHSADAYQHHHTARLALHETQQKMEATVDAVLRWLWDDIAGPVLSALGHTTTPQPGQPGPRVWWCPAGLLSLLPLHAAGHHDRDVTASARRSVLDRVCRPTRRPYGRSTSRPVGQPSRIRPGRCWWWRSPTRQVSRHCRT